MKISASLVLYNTDKDLVEESISSYLNSSLSGPLWIIDNSEGNIYSYLNHSHEKITYIASEENLGYGKAHNIALNHFEEKSEFHIVLNPDISFSDDIVEKLYNFSLKNEKTGIIAPKAEYPDGSNQNNGRLIPNPWHMFFRRFFVFGKYKEDFNKKYELDFKQTENYLAPVILGSFMFIRMSAIKQKGNFDERFFLYPEDIDLSRRIFENFENIILTDLSFTHHHKRESYSNNKSLIIHVKEMIKYYNKWGWLYDEKRYIANEKALTAFKG